MINIRVLGVGSPFGDDQLGLLAAQLLQKKNRFSDNNLQILTCDRPGIKLLDLMQGADAVFIIDAVMTGAPSGTIHRLSIDELTHLPKPLSSHGIGLIEALDIGKALNELPEQLILYGVEIENIDEPFRITKTSQKSIKQIVTMLEQDIKRLLN